MALLALVLTMLGVSDAMAQKIYQAELNEKMFKAWDGFGADANEVEPTSYVGKNDATVEFACEANFYKQLGAGSVVFGNTNVYYKWYANLTGTKKMHFNGTAGVQLRVLLNRPEPNGDDPNGGSSVEKNVTIGSDGTAVLDLTDLEFVHLNAIKTGWGSPAGIIKTIVLEGTVKPVTGILSVINNGDAEGDDLESFPVSYDGPRNGGTANERPEIVGGGVDGSKCFKVTSHEDPTESWHTQFYIKADEVMPKGSKWKLTMAVKGDQAARITTSAQAAPRTWKGGMGIDEFGISTEWHTFTWTGEIGVDDFQSIAFDLSNGDEEVSNTNGDGTVKVNRGYTFYFDNIAFGYDLGGDNPLSDLKVEAYSDIIRVNFDGNTNMATLVKNALTNTLIYDNSTVSVTLNGEPSEVVSVEGYADGNLLIFLLDDTVEEGDVVTVSFKNPEAATHHLVWTGKYEGQDVTEFSGIVATIDPSVDNGDYVSYLWGAPMLESVDPENGSFNLPADFSEFTLTFNQKVKVASVVAKLGNEDLAAAADEAYSRVVKLTRTSTTALNGAKNLVISAAEGEKGADYGLDEPIVLNYSYGPVSEDAQPEVIYASNFSQDGDNANGAGWKVNADAGGLQDANSSTGCRILHNQGAFVDDLVYIAQRNGDNCPSGVALYGIVDDYKLSLEQKTYHVTLGACRHDRTDVALLVQVLPESAVDPENGSLIDEDAVLVEERKEITPEKTSKEAIRFDLTAEIPEAGNYVIRLVPSKGNGSYAGYEDPICFGDVKVEFIPDVMGIVETKKLNDALASAKETAEEISLGNDADEKRYEGEDLTALQTLIAEVEANKASYTAPSVYVAKAEELAAKAKAVKDHKSACDTYDTNIKKAIDLVADNAETKFNQTKVYSDLKATIEKYHGSKTVENLAGEDEDPIWQSTYSFDVLKDNAALEAANAELTSTVNVGSSFFTTVDLAADIQQGNCGVAVLVERNRLGARTLLSLGVEESDPLIEAVKNSISDSEDLTAQIKGRIKTELYKQMKEADNTLFDAVEDESTGELVGKSYDMTVFIKNPNIYCVDGTQGLSEENIPGWTFPISGAGLFKKWDPQRNVAGLPEDCAFTTWYGTNRMEQTITDLPAGVYVVTLCGSDWSNQAGQADNPHDVNGFVYCKTSDTPAVEEGAEEDRELNFAATRTIVYGGQYNMDHALNLGYAEVIDDETGFVSTADGEFYGITVTDGKLTLGIHFAGDAQYFFQHARLTLTGAAAGYDYAKDYTDLITGVDAAVAPTVRALQVYDLNGRRMIKAQKGLQIVKKQMSDGTVRVEKVIVK